MNLNAKLVWVIILMMLVIGSYGQCHYSCSQCVSTSPTNMYTKCTTCPSQQLKVLYTEYNSTTNISKSRGLCGGQLSSDPNLIGIILLIVLIVVCCVINTKQSIYIFYTLQNLALISFVECGWRSIDQLLQSLQYLLVFNIIDRSSRTSTSVNFNQEYYYRLDQYYKKSTNIVNIKFVGAINIVIVFLMIIIPLYMYIRNKYLNSSQNNQNILSTQEIRSDKPSENNDNNENNGNGIRQYLNKNNLISDQQFESVLTVLYTIFFLIMLQTTLTLMVSIKFVKSQSSQVKAIVGIICVIYLLFLVFVMVSLYFRSLLPYFANKISMYINLWKKLLYPIFVIIPPQYQFVLLVMMIVIFIVEGGFDLNDNPQFSKCSRWLVYKIGQGLVLLFTTIYYAVQRTINKESSVNVIGGFTATVVAIAILSIFGEIMIGIYQFFIKKSFEDRLPGQTIIQQRTINNQVVDSYETEDGLAQINKQIQKEQNINKIRESNDKQSKDRKIRVSEDKNKVMKSRIPNHTLDQINFQDVEIVQLQGNSSINPTQPNTMDVREQSQLKKSTNKQKGHTQQSNHQENRANKYNKQEKDISFEEQQQLPYVRKRPKKQPAIDLELRKRYGLT